MESLIIRSMARYLQFNPRAMRVNRIHIVLLPLLLLILGASVVPADSFVADFLRMDSDIRSAAMGGSRMTARGASAIFGNPARANSDEFGGFAAHEQLYDGLLISDALGAVIPGRKGDFSLGILYAGGSGIWRTELPNPDLPPGVDNLPEAVEEESHHDIALAGGYSRYINPEVTAGASVGGVYRYLADESAYGGFLSAGVEWRPLIGLSLGAAADRMGFYSWSTGKSEFGIPELAASAEYSADIGAGFSGAAVTELRYLPAESEIEGFAGGEVSYPGIFALRAGSNNGNLAAGAEISLLPNLAVGASISLHSDLPHSYRIGLTYSRHGADD